MSQTQAPAIPADNETFWAGLLSMLRAIVLGRRLPPEQLRMFLLFAPPVEYLSAEIVACLLSDNDPNGYLEEPLPENWTLGERVNECECCEGHAYEAEVFKEFTIGMLEKEHPEWKDDWRISYDGDGHESLSYRVLDARGRVHPIACWMEGKLQAIHHGEIEPQPENWRSVAIEFIERALDSIVMDLSGYLDPRADDPAANAVRRLMGIDWYHGLNLVDAAVRIYESGAWDIDQFEGWDCYIEPLALAAEELGWFETYPAKPKKAQHKKQELFAA